MEMKQAYTYGPVRRSRNTSRVVPYTTTKPSRQAIAKVVKSILHRTEEMKQYAASFSSGVYDGTAGTFVSDLVGGITQGITDSQRVGDKLSLLEIDLKIGFTNNTGAASNPFTTWRVMVVQYFADNSSSTAKINDFLLTSTANAGATYGTFSMMNIDFTPKPYRVLYDMPLFVTTGSAASAVNGSVGGPGLATVRSFKVPLGKADKAIDYYAAGTNGPNHIYLFITTDQATLASNPVVFGSYAVRFNDA